MEDLQSRYDKIVLFLQKYGTVSEDSTSSKLSFDSIYKWKVYSNDDDAFDVLTSLIDFKRKENANDIV